MESMFTMTEPPLGVRIMNNPTWPVLTEEARMEKLRTLLFNDLQDQEGGDDSENGNNNGHNLPKVLNQQVAPEPEVGQAHECERVSCTAPSRYESQKRRDWNTFRVYVKNHRLDLQQCSGAHVLEFLRYLDQFGKTKVHLPSCPFYGVPNPPHPCRCPLRQAWGSLDALIGRLRAAFEEHGGKPEWNPFGARLVRLYLREVREMQAKARGVAYGKKKRKCSPPKTSTVASNGPTTPSSSCTADFEQLQVPQHRHHRPQYQHEQPGAHDHQQVQQNDPGSNRLTLPRCQQQPEALDRQQLQQHESGNSSVFDFTNYGTQTDLHPDPHPLNAYSPNSNPLIKPTAISSFRPPLSLHSFLDDLPGRRAATAAGLGWGCGTLYGR